MPALTASDYEVSKLYRRVQKSLMLLRGSEEHNSRVSYKFVQGNAVAEPRDGWRPEPESQLGAFFFLVNTGAEVSAGTPPWTGPSCMKQLHLKAENDNLMLIYGR